MYLSIYFYNKKKIKIKMKFLLQEFIIFIILFQTVLSGNLNV